MEEGITMSLSEWLKAQAEQKRITIQNLVKLSGVPTTYVEALFSGDFGKLPAAPYVHGYLRAIAPIVDGDPDELWKLFKAEAAPRVSGADDVLPKNRFAIASSLNKRWLIFWGIGALLIIYLIFNGARLLGKPMLIMTEPLETSFETSLSSLEFRGVVHPDDALMVGGESVVADETGSFSARQNLAPGLNTIVIEARRFLGRQTDITYEIFYLPSATSTSDELETESISP